MINTTFLWLLLLPVILGAILYFLNKSQEGLVLAGAFVCGGAIVISLAVFMSAGSATSDTEIWNGQVTSKERIQDSYERRYDCMCVTDSKGVQTCQSCYETHYTVDWICQTTLGKYTIYDVDSTSKSRAYNTPNPERWTSIQLGDPVAKEHSYTNYIQAVPNSLFTPSSADLKAKFAPLIPKYPDRVFDFYRINRVLTPGYLIPNTEQWNQDLARMLRTLGPAKQVNVVLVVVKTNDPNYEYALRDAWQGANKNDVVVVIGTTDFPKIEWVRIISWTKNELFKVELRDRIFEMGALNNQVIPAIGDQIAKNFERRKMSEFKYLSSEIDPPSWLIILLIVLLLLGAVGMHFACQHRQSYPF